MCIGEVTEAPQELFNKGVQSNISKFLTCLMEKCHMMISWIYKNVIMNSVLTVQCTVYIDQLIHTVTLILTVYS